jgi:hypothetical protein
MLSQNVVVIEELPEIKDLVSRLNFEQSKLDLRTIHLLFSCDKAIPQIT